MCITILCIHYMLVVNECVRILMMTNTGMFHERTVPGTRYSTLIDVMPTRYLDDRSNRGTWYLVQGTRYCY